VSQFTLTDNTKVITWRIIKLSSFRKCNNGLHFITAWMEVLYMRSFIPNMVLY